MVLAGGGEASPWEKPGDRILDPFLLILGQLSSTGLACAAQVNKHWRACAARLRRGAKFTVRAAEIIHTVPLIEWGLRLRIFTREAPLIRFAAAAGKDAIVVWLRTNGWAWDREACVSAARGGHFGILLWACGMGYDCHEAACALAAAPIGHLAIIDWAHSRDRLGLRELKEVAVAAAENADWPMLEWLAGVQKCPGSPWTPAALAAAANRGKFEVVRWLRGRGCGWTADVCANAARCGHLELLRWARSAGCPWDERTCANAALHGHLDLLKWAVGAGAPLTPSALLNATIRGHAHVLEWFQSKGLGRGRGRGSPTPTPKG